MEISDQSGFKILTNVMKFDSKSIETKCESGIFFVKTSLF
jgi:hypothetical protein